MNEKTKINEPEDLNLIEPGHLIRDAESVTKINGEPAYCIVLKSKYTKNNLLPQKDSLIVIPDKEANKVVLFKGQMIKRLPDMNDAELVDFVRFYK